MFEGWLSFAGTEIINSSRVQAYAPINIRCSCADLAASLGDWPGGLADGQGPYTGPAGNSARGELAAPWFDEGVPESKDFHGFVGIEVTGGSSSTSSRQWTELLSDGGAPGALRRASRELEFKVLAVAAHDHALAYGLAWLGSALRGSNCRAGCSGDELCLYTACPSVPSGVPPWEYPAAAQKIGDQLVRTLFNTALLEGPSVESRTHLAGAVMAEVTFTLKAGWPWWFREPTFVISSCGTCPPQPGLITEIIHGYDPWEHVERCRKQQPNYCLNDDPYCPSDKRPAPPVVLPPPVDPCFPNNPANNPAGEPNAHKFNAGRSLFSIPAAKGPEWLEKVPVITLYTGSKPLERLTIRWYDNPLGDLCTPDDLDLCRACAEVTIPWLPRSALFTFDGRTQTATVDCPGEYGAVSEPRLYGADGGMFTWPVFDCSAAMCCEILAKVESLTPELSMEISLAAREDLI